MNTEKIAQEKLDRADITDLELLSYDIPELKTNEICTQNDFYYNAQVLKDYCNLKSDYQIKAALEHATYMGSDYYWDADINHNLPAVIMQGIMRKAILEKVTDKEIFSIGTYIQYAKPFYAKEKFNKIKKELGKTLLVFPMHSTHWVNLEFNIKDFIDEIKRISKDFDTVMICMYWKDILKNAHSPYQKEGFKIVSAGHIYNKNFLPRLRTIIELSDLVCSNDVGSYVGQAIALNRPVYLYKQDYSFNSTNKEMDDGSEYDLRLKDKNYIDNFKVFSKYSLEITKEQREFANYLWGVDIKLTPEEMVEYFQKLDMEYDKFLAENKRFKLIKKEKQGDKRKITILGFIKLSYKKKQKKYQSEVVGYRGNYSSWDKALKECKGYSAQNILDKTLESTLKVKNGEAVFERDTYIFDEIQYSYPLLASLFKVAVENNNELDVVDFGGALGSHYFQNKDFLKPIKINSWTVVEQEHYIDIGNEKIADGILNFKKTIEEVENSNVLILSSCIQYLPKPYEWLEKLINHGVKYIIVDRTAFSTENRNRLTIESVKEPIYDATYPAWFLNEKDFLAKFEKDYNKILDFESTIDKVNEIPSVYKGFLFKKKDL